MKFTATCYCGKSSMNFRNDIGGRYLGECCELLGFDHMGNPPKDIPNLQEGTLKVSSEPTVPQITSSKSKNKGKKP